MHERPQLRKRDLLESPDVGKRSGLPRPTVPGHMNPSLRIRTRAPLVATLALLMAMLVAPRSVRACPPDVSDRYDKVFNVGVSVGFSMLRRFAFTYALDLRVGNGPFIGWARIEGHGLEYARYLAGLKAFHPSTGAEVETGVALNSAHAGGDIGQAWGLHLAAGRWNPATEGLVQGTIPLVGDRKNYDLGIAAFVAVPGNWLYAIGCNG